MTTQPVTLDPSDINITPDQAFVHPLPQIRQFHRQLTTALDEKNARLRTLVGGSYRQLLGTAETILEMRKDIQVVEDKLGKVGEACGRESIAREVRGLGTLHASRGNGYAQSLSQLEWIAKLKLMNACALVVGRLLRQPVKETSFRGNAVLLAAKVLVLSRLLAKSIGKLSDERAENDQTLLEDIRKKLASLRRRLLRIIEMRLQKPEANDNRDGILQALSAYGLATNSGAKDVLRHFLHIRGEAIALAFEDDENVLVKQMGSLEALRIYTATLLDVQALMPRRLSDILATLKTKALLRDESIQDLESLRLDVCEKWLGDEIMFFKPYLRHDDLDTAQAADTLKGWSKRAIEVLLQGLSQELQRSLDFKTVVTLRTQLLELWIKEGRKAKGFDASILLDGLRRVFNKRLDSVLQGRVSKLHLVSTEIEATLGTWQQGISDKHQTLWEESMLDLDIANGAERFKESLVSRSYGRNDPVHRVFSGYRAWRHLVDEITTLIDELRRQRWDDDIENFEDDSILEARNIALSRTDPQMLQDQLDTLQQSNYNELEQSIELLIGRYSDHDDIGAIAIYMLRIIRDIRADIPRTSQSRSFGLSLVPLLHQHLARSISAEPVRLFKNRFTKSVSPCMALWEGTPELPVLPSPNVFGFLRAISTAMGSAGNDLWSPHAVMVLKTLAGRMLAEAMESCVKLEVGPLTNGTEAVNGSGNDGVQEGTVAEELTKGEEPLAEKGAEGKTTTVLDNDKRKQWLTQALLDTFVLTEALSSEHGFANIEKVIDSEIDLDVADRKRLQHAAREYWKRSNLLFGPLAKT